MMLHYRFRSQGDCNHAFHRSSRVASTAVSSRRETVNRKGRVVVHAQPAQTNLNVPEPYRGPNNPVSGYKVISILNIP